MMIIEILVLKRIPLQESNEIIIILIKVHNKRKININSRSSSLSINGIDSKHIQGENSRSNCTSGSASVNKLKQSTHKSNLIEIKTKSTIDHKQSNNNEYEKNEIVLNKTKNIDNDKRDEFSLQFTELERKKLDEQLRNV